MSHYDYALRGNNCFPSTCALTSNEKFLPLMDPAYYMQYTQTDQYPGQTYDFIRRLKNVHSPEDIKAYLGTKNHIQTVHHPVPQIHGAHAPIPHVPIIDPHEHGHPGHPHLMHGHKPVKLDVKPKKRSCNQCSSIY